MSPYHPNSDALLPPPVLPRLPAEPVFPMPLSDDDLVFTLAVFELFFFSVLEPDCSSLDFGRLDFVCADDLDAFANTVFLGVGLAVGFGVAFGFAVGRGGDVAVGVGFDKSISLFAWATDARSFSVSSGFNGSDSTDGVEIFVGSAALVSDFSAARSSAPLNQTKLSACGALRAAKLQ